MNEPLTLRRPANWQTFEELCWRLWSEIWEYPETQMHGRTGQEQQGVDIYGIPNGYTGYVGIQCKGKSEYSETIHPQFTEGEIETEIEKAKTFDPPLKKYYLVTTALNDARIQLFIRKKNLEHLEQGLFEIHIFCWEHIVKLIDNNMQTQNWYVKGHDYKINKSVKIMFENGTDDITLVPEFRQTIWINNDALEKMQNTWDKLGKSLVPRSVFGSRHQLNRSYVPINLRILNSGSASIQHWKVNFEIKGPLVDLSDTNEIIDFPVIFPGSSKLRDVQFNKHNNGGRIAPILPKVLVGNESYVSDVIYLKPKAEECKILIHWELLSDDYKDSGVLTVNIIPKIITQRRFSSEKELDNLVENGDIEDMIIAKTEE